MDVGDKKPNSNCNMQKVGSLHCILYLLSFSVSNGGSLLKQCALLIKQNMSLILFSGWQSSHRHCLLRFSLTPSPKPSTLCWVSLATPQHRWGNLWIKPSHSAKHSYKKWLIIDWYGYSCTVPSHLIKCRSGAFLTVGSVPTCLQLKSHSHHAVDEEYSQLLTVRWLAKHYQHMVKLKKYNWSLEQHLVHDPLFTVQDAVRGKTSCFSSSRYKS